MEKLRTALGFAGILQPEEINEIMHHFEERLLHADEHFLTIGKVSNELGFIDKGIVRLYATGDKGEEVTKYFFRPNQFVVDLESYYNNKPAESGLHAVVPARLFVVKKSMWNKMYEQIPRLFLLTKTISEAQLITKLKDSDFLLFGTAATKYREFVRRYPDLALQIPQQYIASYLKITPQSLSRIRKAMLKQHNK